MVKDALSFMKMLVGVANFEKSNKLQSDVTKV